MGVEKLTVSSPSQTKPLNIMCTKLVQPQAASASALAGFSCIDTWFCLAVTCEICSDKRRLICFGCNQEFITWFWSKQKPKKKTQEERKGVVFLIKSHSYWLLMQVRWQLALKDADCHLNDEFTVNQSKRTPVDTSHCDLADCKLANT